MRAQGELERRESPSPKRWKFVLAGASGAGKTTLCKAILGIGHKVMKTQGPEFHQEAVIDLPGEYMTHPHMRRSFLASMQDVRALVYVQAADAEPPHVPAGLFQAVPGLELLGVINKMDLPTADLERSRRHLAALGIAEPYYAVSALQADSLAVLRERLRDEGLIPA